MNDHRHLELTMQLRALATETVYSEKNLEFAGDILAARLLPEIARYAQTHNIGLLDAIDALRDIVVELNLF